MKPFTIQVTVRSVTFTAFKPVPGVAYLQPDEQFRIPIQNWRALLANGGPEAGSVTFCNFTPEQLKAHGAT